MSTGRWCVLPADIALDKSLSMAEFRVLVVISTHSNKSGWCKLKLATIADECGIHFDTARRAVKDLEGRGYLLKVRRRTYCEYTIVSDRAEMSDQDCDEDPSQECAPVHDQDCDETPSPYRTGYEERVKKNNTPLNPPKGEGGSDLFGKYDDPPPKPLRPFFEEWWEMYPKKVKKKAAERKFLAIVKSGEATYAQLVAGLRRYLMSERVGKGFIMDPTTWLNGGCWDDEAPSIKETDPVPIQYPDTEDGWGERVQIFFVDNKWSRSWGPKPGEPGCLVPERYLPRRAS